MIRGCKTTGPVPAAACRAITVVLLGLAPAPPEPAIRARERGPGCNPIPALFETGIPSRSLSTATRRGSASRVRSKASQVDGSSSKVAFPVAMPAM
jgi:hypothetical protein